jgi:hypothetical protein
MWPYSYTPERIFKIQGRKPQNSIFSYPRKDIVSNKNLGI